MILDDLSRRFCMYCKHWGADWVKDLMRNCWHPDREPQLTAMMFSCDYFEEDRE